MVTLLVVNDTDLTEYINKKSYKVNSKNQYESWKDGNYVEHRIIVRNRVEGSFEIAVYGHNDVDYAAFLDIWNSAVNNGVVTMGVWVQDQNRFKAIEAYYAMEGLKHHELLNGDFYDRVKITFTER